MKRLFGGILLGVGLLIAGASGLCTLVFLILSLGHGSIGIAPLALIVGGVPMVMGGLLVYAGQYLLRQDKDE